MLLRSIFHSYLDRIGGGFNYGNGFDHGYSRYSHLPYLTNGFYPYIGYNNTNIMYDRYFNLASKINNAFYSSQNGNGNSYLGWFVW